MGAHNLAEFFDRLAALIMDNETLLRWLDEQITSDGPDDLETQAGKLVQALNETGANAAWKKVKPLREDFVKRSRKARKGGSHDLPFVHVRDLLSGLEELQDDFPELGDRFSEYLRDRLGALHHSYDDFLSTNTPGAFFTFFQRASECHRLLSSTRDQALLASATIGIPPEDDREILSVTFEGVQRARDVADIVRRFETIYSELAPYLDIDPEQEPLLVAYIEVGSLRSWLRGNLSLIQLVERLLFSFLGYVHRNHTVEGRIQQFPKKSAAAQEVADLKKNLKDAGVDTSGMEQELEQTANHLAEELSALIHKGTGIVLRDESLTPKKTAKLEQPDNPYILAPAEEIDDEREDNCDEQ